MPRGEFGLRSYCFTDSGAGDKLGCRKSDLPLCSALCCRCCSNCCRCCRLGSMSNATPPSGFNAPLLRSTAAGSLARALPAPWLAHATLILPWCSLKVVGALCQCCSSCLGAGKPYLVDRMETKRDRISPQRSGSFPVQETTRHIPFWKFDIMNQLKPWKGQVI